MGWPVQLASPVTGQGSAGSTQQGSQQRRFDSVDHPVREGPEEREDEHDQRRQQVARHHIARIVRTHVHPGEAQEPAEDDVGGGEGPTTPRIILRSWASCPVLPRTATYRRRQASRPTTRRSDVVSPAGDDRVVRGERVVVGLGDEDVARRPSSSGRADRNNDAHPTASRRQARSLISTPVRRHGPLRQSKLAHQVDHGSLPARQPAQDRQPSGGDLRAKQRGGAANPTVEPRSEDVVTDISERLSSTQDGATCSRTGPAAVRCLYPTRV